MSEEIKDVETKEDKKVNKKKEETKIEPISNKGYVISRLSHPVEISYSGNSFMLPPRGQQSFEDLSLVGPLPNGVYTRKAV